MPRRRKGTLAPGAPQDQGYGVRGEQIAAQNAVPLPDRRGGGAGPPPGGPPPAAPPAGGAGSLEAALAAAQGIAPPAGGLGAPSGRTDEPITAGLSSGPGPGPGPMGPALPEPDPVVEILRAAYDRFRTPAILALLERAQREA